MESSAIVHRLSGISGGKHNGRSACCVETSCRGSPPDYADRCRDSGGSPCAYGGGCLCRSGISGTELCGRLDGDWRFWGSGWWISGADFSKMPWPAVGDCAHETVRDPGIVAGRSSRSGKTVSERRGNMAPGCRRREDSGIYWTIVCKGKRKKISAGIYYQYVRILWIWDVAGFW